MVPMTLWNYGASEVINHHMCVVQRQGIEWSGLDAEAAGNQSLRRYSDGACLLKAGTPQFQPTPLNCLEAL